jgi:hypothetical protein
MPAAREAGCYQRLSFCAVAAGHCSPDWIPGAPGAAVNRPLELAADVCVGLVLQPGVERRRGPPGTRSLRSEPPPQRPGDRPADVAVGVVERRDERGSGRGVGAVAKRDRRRPEQPRPLRPEDRRATEAFPEGRVVKAEEAR